MNFLLAGGGGKKRGGARWGAGGACPCAALARRALAAPAGVACLLCRLLALPPRCLVGGRGCFGRLPPLPLAFFPAPIPPAPLPGGKGGTKVIFMQGAPPLASPGLNLRGTGSTCQSGIRPGVSLRRCQFDAKPTEILSSGQCRQPRRGGTGGEELRRLRWSSPPGQGEQVPQGE